MAFSKLPFDKLMNKGDDYNRFLFNLLKTFKLSLCKYLKIAESDFHHERITANLRDVFRCNIISSVMDGVSPKSIRILKEKLSSENNEITIINFNYTKTFDRIFLGDGNSQTFDFDLGEARNAHFEIKGIIHPHGTLEQGDILFGVSEPETIKDAGAREFSRLTGFLAKPNAAHENGSRSVDDAFHAMFESKMVIVFGMSLGMSDIVWWENIRGNLSSFKDHIVYFRYSDSPFKIQDDSDWKVLKAEGRDAFFKTCKPRMDSTDRNALDHYIHKVDIAHYGPYKTNLPTPRFCDPFDLEWFKSKLVEQ